MILSNIEIHRALDEGGLVIEPEPRPRQPSIDNTHCPYGTHSVDLRLGEEIAVPKNDCHVVYDLASPGSIADTIQSHSTREVLTDDRPYRLKPHKFVLGRTLEKIRLPLVVPGISRDYCLAARIEGKSSRARFGLLVHFTAPTVHPGFEGTLTLEMINLGPADILLLPRMPIAQLIIEEVRGCPIENPSEFQGQSHPAGVAGSSTNGK